MKLLILGESDSKGGGLEDPSLAWGELIPVELERRFGIPVECTHVRFYAHSPNCLSYLEAVLDQGPFDVVLFSLTTIGFTFISVENRVRRLLGRRAGDWVKKRMATFDGKARQPGKHPVRLKVRFGMHEFAHKFIGQEGAASYSTVLKNHRRIVARLARLEDTDILLLGPTNHGGVLAEWTRKLQPSVDAFRGAMREEAENRRFLWLDRQELSLQSADRDAEFTDGVHKGIGFHRRIAETAVDMLGAHLELAGHRELVPS
jgi:hypothetical protein